MLCQGLRGYQITIFSQNILNLDFLKTTSFSLEYDPSNTEEAERNEERLREFAAETTFDQENYVSRLLLDSANNCTEAHLSEDKFGEDDLHFLIDFDTAWMGLEPAEYEKYREAARAEVGNISDSEYVKRRLQVRILVLLLRFRCKGIKICWWENMQNQIVYHSNFLNFVLRNALVKLLFICIVSLVQFLNVF